MEFFLVIFPLILEAIMKCREENTEGRTRKGLRKRSPLVALALRGILKHDITQDGVMIHNALSGRVLADETRKGLKVLRGVGRTQIADMVTEADCHRLAGTSPAAEAGLVLSSR